jgi:hypothetical protein
MKLQEILNLNEFFDIKVKNGDILFLGDIQLKVIDTRPMPFQPPRVVNVKTGNEFTLRSNDIPKLSKSSPKVDGFGAEKKFREWVKGVIRGIEFPKQSVSFAKFVDSGKSSGYIQLTFTEEVKDGRDSKFNTELPLKLKGSKFEYNGVSLQIMDVKLSDTDSESIRGSVYNTFNYTIKLKRI